MEAFSLLKYWRGSGVLGVVGGNNGTDGSGRSGHTRPGTTTIVTKAVQADEGEDDDGPFFDLEFAVPDEDETEAEGKKEGEEVAEEEEEEEESGSDSEKEFNFTLSSSSSSDPDPNLALSPSDDLFFKGRLVTVEEPNSSVDAKLPHFPVSLLKSATKFRVLMLRFKKSKLERTEAANGSSTTAVGSKKMDGIDEENGNGSNKSRFFTVKFKVEEVPIVSLFTKSQKQSSAEESALEEKKFSKDVMQKYLKKVKPLYVRVSKRYGEKLRFSGQLNLSSLKPTAPPTAEKAQTESEVGENQANLKKLKEGNIPAGLRVVCKHLGKSRSASSAVAAAPCPALSQRRDDSLLQQQDGIQSAILHCKRSFNGSQDTESSLLPRCVSDSCHEKKSIDSSRNQGKERKKN